MNDIPQTTPKGRLVNNYRSSLRLIFRLMTSKKAFVIEHYSIQILSDETRYHIFWAICLERSSSRTLISPYLQATLCFSSLYYLGPIFYVFSSNKKNIRRPIEKFRDTLVRKGKYTNQTDI